MLRRLFVASLLFLSVAVSNFVLTSVSYASLGPQAECAQVCSGVKAKLKANARQVEYEYKQWQERLGVKSDIVRFDQGYSAAEELLRFMSTYYRRQAPGQQMEPTFLAYVMTKCFPETYVDPSRARMDGLVDTMWAAEHLKIENQMNSCK